MRHHHALGRGGGPGGVLQERHGIGISGCRGERRFRRGQLVDGQPLPCGAERLECRSQRLEQPCDRQHGCGRAVADDGTRRVLNLAAARRIDRHGNDIRVEAAEVGGDEFDALREHQQRALARFAPRAQQSRHRRRLFVEFAIGRGGVLGTVVVEEDVGDAVRLVDGATREDLGK